SGNVENDSNSAITNSYRIIFPNSCTKFSEKLCIMIHTIGISKHEDWNWAGPGYTASLTYEKDNLLYLQGFEYNKYYIQVYNDKGLLNTVYGKDPNDVWKNFTVLKNYSGIQLYGLEESLMDKLLQHAKQLVCLSNEWFNETILIGIQFFMTSK
ncbi:16394_t:CDS:2, partial [Gigaspora margarita]